MKAAMTQKANDESAHREHSCPSDRQYPSRKVHGLFTYFQDYTSDDQTQCTQHYSRQAINVGRLLGECGIEWSEDNDEDADLSDRFAQ